MTQTEVSGHERRAVFTEQDILPMLNPLRFNVRREPLFTKDGMNTNRVALINESTGRLISTPTDKYRLMPYSENLIPAVERMVGEGWKAPPFHNNRRQPVRTESNGLRAYVELWHPNSIEVNGEVIHPRLTLRNSYDAQSVLGCWAGGGVVRCANGIYVFHQFMGHVGRRHIGAGEGDNDRLLRLADTFLKNFDEVASNWRALEALRPGEERSVKAIEQVSVRKADSIIERVEGVEYIDDANGWQVFQAITNYLTFDYKGGERLGRIKQKRALEVLQGA